MKNNQYYRITLEDAIVHYQKGWITATALLYYYLKIRLAPGWKITLHQKEITEKLGISKTSFYRAIENLSKEGLIDWEAPNGIVISVPQTGLSSTNGTLSSTNGTLSSTNGTLSSTNGTNTPSKSLSEKDFSDPSDYYQINNISLSDSEREVLIKEKKPDSHSELNDSSNSSVLNEALNSTSEKNQNFERGQISATSLNNSSNFANPNLQNLAPKEKNKFLAFAKKKASELPKLPTLLNRWIEKHFAELYEQFCVLEKQREAARVAREATFSKDSREINSSDRSQNNKDKTNSFTPVTGEFLQQLKKEVINNAQSINKSTSRMY